MRRWKLLIPIAVAVAGVIVGPATAAHASTVVCNGSFTGTTNGAVIVPSGGTCFMDGATVKGSVTVFPNAALETCGAYIGGNVQSSNDYVNLGDLTTVQGNVVVNHPGIEGTFQTDPCNTETVTPKIVTSEFAALICPAFIGGNLTVSNAPADLQTIEVCYSHIVGNVQILNNQELVLVDDNRIDGSLVCIHNHTAYEAVNVVKGADIGCPTATG